MNALVDPEMIDALYIASATGVSVDLIVRGICCLRPGIPGLSDRIRVVSIVGRLLEHSRLYFFRNGGDEELFLGSADLMPRNLDHRVEVLAPVEDAGLKRHLVDEVLAGYLRDNVQATALGADGSYSRVWPDEGSPVFDMQAHLISTPRHIASHDEPSNGISKHWNTVVRPHPLWIEE
jgi:polyphosphate kinase